MATATKEQEAPATPATERKSEPKGRVVRVGNLTRDPELRFGASGMPYAKFGLAVERPKVAGDWAGERTTEFYECMAFNTLAENVAECLHKGDRAIVEGDASLETYTGKDGGEHERKVIFANAVGAELRFATVEVHKAQRKQTTRATAPVEDDEEPF
jgi:single-strand DNA-binding protein